MAQYLIPAELLNSLAQIASQAPVPYAQTQPIWKAIEALKPEPETPADPAS